MDLVDVIGWIALGVQKKRGGGESGALSAPCFGASCPSQDGMGLALGFSIPLPSIIFY